MADTNEMTCPLGVCAGLAVCRNETHHLHEATASVEKKLDRLQWWIMGALATSAGSLLLLLLKHPA